MTQKFQTLENKGRKSSNHWKFLAVLFPIIGTCAYAFAPGGQAGFFSAWWKAGDPYERLGPTAYWYPSADLNNTDRILGIASTNTVNTASVTANGWEFNGSSQYLDMGRPVEIEVGTNLLYSMSAWVLPSDTLATGYRGIMGKLSINAGDRWGMYARQTSQFRTVLDEGGGFVAISPSGSYSTGQWYHVSITINRLITNGYILYVDGVSVGTATFTDTDPINYTSQPNLPFRFGVWGSSEYWKGYIDQAAVWNGRALTSNEVFNLFEATRTGRK